MAGPTVFLLDLAPTTVMNLLNDLPDMFSVYPSQGQTELGFMQSWTTLLWAWWISWSPFVGMFIVKISRGRTLRQFVGVVVLVPTGISIRWFVIFGGSAIYQRLTDQGPDIRGSGENVMFDMVDNLPLIGITSVVVLIAILIFFVTAADSATNAMGSMSQPGQPVPSTPVTIISGSVLGLVAMSLLLAGGENALSGLQSIMVSSALPFAIILVGVLICRGIDLRNDPLMIRRGVAEGIDQHGDDVISGVTKVAGDESAGAGFKSDDPNLTEWYTDVLPDNDDGDGTEVKRKPL